MTSEARSGLRGRADKRRNRNYLTAMSQEARINIPEWSVSELAAALKRTVEDAYGFVRVRGEISGYRGPHASGHCYFALKDEGARIDAVIWKGTFGRIRFKPEEGLEVIATGRLTTYPGRSSYQIVIDSLEPAGVGALMALLEERKKKLAAEGLFDEARKQLLPYLPDVIGVITSPTGAVIRDILHRLADRFPRHVLVWPVRGQGHRRTELRAAMRALPTADTLLSIPRQRVDACADRLPRALRANAQVHHTAFSRISGRLTPQLLRGQVERRRARYAAAAGLLAASLRHNAEAQRTRIARNFERVAVLAGRAERAVLTLLDRRAARLERAGQLLAALSYHGVLARGFALGPGPEGQPLRTAAAGAPGVGLDIGFQYGHLRARAEAGATEQRAPVARRRPKARRRPTSGEGQGSLF